MANNVAGTGTGIIDQSAVASVVSGVLNAMGFQQSGGAGDTPSSSGNGGSSVSSNSRYQKLVIACYMYM